VAIHGGSPARTVGRPLGCSRTSMTNSLGGRAFVPGWALTARPPAGFANQDRIIWVEQRLEGCDAAAEPKVNELLTDIKEAVPLLSEAMALEWCRYHPGRDPVLGAGLRSCCGFRGHCHRADLGGAVHRLQRVIFRSNSTKNRKTTSLTTRPRVARRSPRGCAGDLDESSCRSGHVAIVPHDDLSTEGDRSCLRAFWCCRRRAHWLEV
jgi:hypothetical protein